jgi:micrococcal nuclease
MDGNKILIQAMGILWCLLMAIPAGLAADFQGEVIRVLDGDTIEVLHDKKPERIRLYGIDCPEKGQAFGQKAKQATSSLLFGKDVRIESHGRDKHRRTLGTVFDGDLNVNHELVKEGWCWWFRKLSEGPDAKVKAALSRGVMAKAQLESIAASTNQNAVLNRRT